MNAAAQTVPPAGSGARVKAVLLAAGLGTRLRPITDTMPKCLVPIGDRPILDYWFDGLSAAGVREVLLNTHHLPEQVRSYIEKINAADRFHVTEAYEPKLLGSAGTIHANGAWMDDADDCLIVYADNLSSVDLRGLLAFHRSHDDPFTMLLFHTQFPKSCGIAELDAQGRVVEFVEKPNEPRSDLANAGVYGVSREAYREIAAMDGFDLGFDVLPKFVGRMRGWAFDGYHRDIGSHEALEQAREDVASGVFGNQKGANT